VSASCRNRRAPSCAAAGCIAAVGRQADEARANAVCESSSKVGEAVANMNIVNDASPEGVCGSVEVS